MLLRYLNTRGMSSAPHFRLTRLLARCILVTYNQLSHSPPQYLTIHLLAEIPGPASLDTSSLLTGWSFLRGPSVQAADV